MYVVKNTCSHKYICNNLSKFIFWNTRYGMKQQIRSCSKLIKMEWTILNKSTLFPPKWFCNKAEKIENCLLFCLISNHYWNIKKNSDTKDLISYDIIPRGCNFTWQNMKYKLFFLSHQSESLFFHTKNRHSLWSRNGDF